jgi:hypothetical protein
MPVTFGTVEVIPQPAAVAPTPSVSGKDAARSSASQATDPRELEPALHQLHDREARVRAH